MKSRFWASAIAFASLLLTQIPARAQFAFDNNAVQVHSFFTQGFAVSNENNYLTMNTSSGSGQMTDGGVNVTWRLTDKLRVGAQAYDRYIGQLGKGAVTLDWALADYHFTDWFGVRGGVVKTALGLFNDSQDQEFLYTWALLPQGVYPTDLRDMTISHIGGDLYGNLNLKRAGSLSYQLWAGKLPTDLRSGYVYGIEDSGFKNVNISSKGAGYDLRWTLPGTGLIFGTSAMFAQRNITGMLVVAPLPISADSYMDRQFAVYGEYTRGKWRFDGELREHKVLTRIYGLPPSKDMSGQISPGWFTALSYRISSRVEMGTYRSGFNYTPLFTPPGLLTGPGANFINDQAATVRVDLTKFWNVKVEGHFMDGFGNILSARGFYPRDNTQGLKPVTNMLVLRTGFNF